MIEEYARIFRNLFWFNPKILLIKEERIIEKTNIKEIERVIIKTTIGAIFCQVNKRRHLVQSIPSITSGNQKWNGAIPNFIKIAEWRIIINEFSPSLKVKVNEFSRIIIEKINIVDAKVWIIKYFIEASLE